MAERIRVEVVWALPERAVVRVVELAPGTSVGEAIDASGIAGELGGMDIATMPIGCYGRIVDRHAAVADGDRLELYRPLRVDPKQARRERRRR